MYILANEWIRSVFGSIFFNIDKAIYGAIGNVYELLMSIARTTIFDQATIQTFASRVYALIGIFMLFKVTFSLVTYVLNPDSFADKEKGISSIGKNILISLSLTILTPYIFAEAYNLQNIILEENTLATVVFGTPGTNTKSNKYYISRAGEQIKFVLMYTFFQPNIEGYSSQEFTQSGGDINSCKEIYAKDEDGNYKYIEGSDNQLQLNPNCFGNLVNNLYGNGGELSSKFSKASATTEYANYSQGIAQQSFGLLFREELITLQADNQYIINYEAPLSTAVGIATLWILIIFCIDIAVRSIKLGFLQLIAPIPIISYVDPKSGKDGMFKKWYKACFSTFLSLFIRLLALYFAIFIISRMCEMTDVITGERVDDWWVKIFIILGTLIFAKQLPKLIEDISGIKMDGGFTLNPLKKLEKEALGGKLLSTAGKRALSTATAVPFVGAAGLLSGQGFRLGAMGKALKGGLKGEKFGKNFANSYGAARARKKAIDQMHMDGVSPWAVAGQKFKNAFGGETPAEHNKAVGEKLAAVTKGYDNIKETVMALDSQAKTLKAQADSIKAAGSTAFNDIKGWGTDETGHKVWKVTKSAASQYADAIKAAEDAIDARIDAVAAGAAIDNSSKEVAANGAARIDNYKATMAALINSVKSEAGVEGVVDINHKSIKTVGKAAQGAKGLFESSSEYIEAEDLQKYAGGSKK